MQKMLTFASEDEWFIGKPDLLVTTSDFTMYSNGPDWWIDQFAEMTLTEDRGNIFAENTGMLLKAGTRLRFDMQYFAIGSEQDNRTTIAFKFYPKGVVPKYQVRSVPIRNIPNDELEIPPNTVVRTDGYFRLTRKAP